jgi:endoglycosylceramidase
MTGRGVIAPVAALLALFLAVPAVASAARIPPTLGHEGRWITDRAGRVVTLHGWNMVSKLAPYG